MTLKSQPGGWILSRKPDLCIARSREPATLTLEQAVEWIRRNRPALWVGSIFSVPEPSGFPSGYALTRSLLDMIFPPGDGVHEPSRTGLIDSMVGKWPLERLLDEFESLHYDLSESLLNFFAEHDRAATPNLLHEAVVRYYEAGLSGISLCVTTNWDTLLEKAALSGTVRLHDSRHFAASLLAALGVHPRTAMEILGHNDIKITMLVYSHVDLESKQDAAEKIDAAFGGR